MKAIQLLSPEEFLVIDIPDPADPGPGEALVRVHRVGICGTDVSGYLGNMPFFSYPRIPGHELGVEVLAVGPDVTNVAAGDRCSVEPYLNCGDCYACRKGAGNCCMHLQVLGVMTDGGLRDSFVVPAAKLHPSKSLTFDQLALVETLAIGCHAVNRSGLKAGETCAIVGAGPIGLAVLEFVKLAGAVPAVVDLNPTRLEFCRHRMGVTRTVAPTGVAADDLRRAFGGDLPDVLIDATGNAGAMSRSFGLIAPTGRVVFVGITTKDVSFTHPTFHRPEGTLLCSRNALPADFTRIIGLIEAGELKTDPWVSHRSTFDSLIRDFPAYTRPESGVIKAVVSIN